MPSGPQDTWEHYFDAFDGILAHFVVLLGLDNEQARKYSFHDTM